MLLLVREQLQILHQRVITSEMSSYSTYLLASEEAVREAGKSSQLV